MMNKNKLLKLLGLDNFKYFNPIQRMLILGINIEIMLYGWAYTSILIELTNNGVINTVSKPISVIVPALGRILLKNVYDKNKSYIRRHLHLLYDIDILVSVISTLLIFSFDIKYMTIGWWFLFVISNSSVQVLLNYAGIDLTNEIFSTVKEMTEYTKSFNQIGSYTDIVGYSMALLTPIIPTEIIMVIAMLSTCAGSIIYNIILKKLDKIKV